MDSEVKVITAPESIQVSLQGFSDTDAAEKFGNTIGTAVHEISRLINLERLDGITVAYDYDDALAGLDRGFQATRRLTRTADNHLLGVAMAPAVLRDGVVKGHIVFHAPFILPLGDEASEHFRQALYFLAHECAHVEDLMHRDESFPDTILQQEIVDYEEALLDQVASAIWDEYAACRASARFSPEQAATYEESFVKVLKSAHDQANSAIRSYRLHGDINRVLQEAGRPLCEPLRLAAYLFGHLDGRSVDLDIVPIARDAMFGSPYQTYLEQLWASLRFLWPRRGQWESRAEFTPLYNLARDTLKGGGIILQRQPDKQLYVSIPFTPETMP